MLHKFQIKDLAVLKGKSARLKSLINRISLKIIVFPTYFYYNKEKTFHLNMYVNI